VSAEKIRHLEEHLPYELLMLRYTHQQLFAPQHQLDFNCYLECFVIHARILYNFLTNEQDARNFKATDFGQSYQPLPHNELSGAMFKLNSQILHFAKCRPNQPEKKFNTARVDKIHKWIEREISRFVKELSPEYRSHWNDDHADLEKFTPQSVGLKFFNTSSSETSGLILIRQHGGATPG
jgi:hypothetical protein